MEIQEVLKVAFMISSFLLAIRIASVKGAILYPVRRFFLKVANKKKEPLMREVQELRRSMATTVQEEEMKKLLEKMDEVEYKILIADIWHKPVFTCVTCMTPWWGSMVCIGYSFYEPFSFGSYFFGILLSLIVNYTYSAWLLKD